MGEVSDFSIFLSAVIDEKSFDRISNYIDAAKADPSCTILAGGNCDKSKGKFHNVRNCLNILYTGGCERELHYVISLKSKPMVKDSLLSQQSF